MAALVAETVLTFMFLTVILGSTDRRAPAGFAPIAIGLHLDSFGWNPRDQSFSEPGPQHRPGSLCRRMGVGTAMVILACPDCGCHSGRVGL